MSRIVNLLAGLTIASAATVTASCDSTGCTSCVGTGLAVACVNYTAPTPLVPCTSLTCNQNCPSTPCTANCDTTCQTCVNNGHLIGACVTATVGNALLLTSQASLDAGFDVSVFGASSSTTVNVDASSSGTVSATNAIVNLAGTSAIAALNVGAGVASSAIFQVNSSVTVNAWTNNAAQARVDNNGGALVVGNLSVGGSSFSVFQSGSASITVSSIDFTARGAFSGRTDSNLLISGGTAHLGGSAAASGSGSGSASGSGSVSGSGNIALAGGVSVDGNIPQGVNIKVAAQGKSAPLAVVEASTTLSTSGEVQGNDGTVVVNGQFSLGSTTTTVQPKVVVNNLGKLVINSATQLRASAVQVSTGATLVLGASANKASVYVDKFTQCLGTVQITLSTTAGAFISASNASSNVALTYSANNVPADLAKCAVTVVDSAGTTYTLQSTTSASAGRRLLGSSGTANWGDSQMTYTMGQQASSAPASFAILPIAILSVFASLM